MLLSKNSRSLTQFHDTRICGRFPVGPFVHKGFRRRSPDDTIKKRRTENLDFGEGKDKHVETSHPFTIYFQPGVEVKSVTVTRQRELGTFDTQDSVIIDFDYRGHPNFDILKTCL